MTGDSPFHSGEIAVQRMAGLDSVAANAGRMIQARVPQEALAFLQKQSMLWIGIADDSAQPWAFPLFGPPGFVHSEDGGIVLVEFGDDFLLPGEWARLLQPGQFIGCLAIDLASRQRLRINGLIRDVDIGQLSIGVQQSYPNCPKYIRHRELARQPTPAGCTYHSGGTTLDETLANIVRRADTAWVASLGPDGADVSHRGGPPGFIHMASKTRLMVPDYRGNNLFNTLGNFHQHPVGGLTVMDFDFGNILQLSGRVRLLFDHEEPDMPTGETYRYWELEISRWHLYSLSLDCQWMSLDFSPFNPTT